MHFVAQLTTDKAVQTKLNEFQGEAMTKQEN